MQSKRVRPGIRSPLEHMLILMLWIIIPFNICMGVLYTVCLMFTKSSSCQQFCEILEVGQNFLAQNRIQNCSYTFSTGKPNDTTTSLEITDTNITKKPNLKSLKGTKNPHRFGKSGKHKKPDTKGKVILDDWIEKKALERLTSTVGNDVELFLKQLGLTRQNISTTKPTPKIRAEETTLKYVIYSRSFGHDSDEFPPVFVNTMLINPITTVPISKPRKKGRYPKRKPMSTTITTKTTQKSTQQPTSKSTDAPITTSTMQRTTKFFLKTVGLSKWVAHKVLERFGNTRQSDLDGFIPSERPTRKATNKKIPTTSNSETTTKKFNQAPTMSILKVTANTGTSEEAKSVFSTLKSTEKKFPTAIVIIETNPTITPKNVVLQKHQNVESWIESELFERLESTTEDLDWFLKSKGYITRKTTAMPKMTKTHRQTLHFTAETNQTTLTIIAQTPIPTALSNINEPLEHPTTILAQKTQNTNQSRSENLAFWLENRIINRFTKTTAEDLEVFLKDKGLHPKTLTGTTFEGTSTSSISSNTDVTTNRNITEENNLNSKASDDDLEKLLVEKVQSTARDDLAEFLRKKGLFRKVTTKQTFLKKVGSKVSRYSESVTKSNGNTSEFVGNISHEFVDERNTTISKIESVKLSNYPPENATESHANFDEQNLEKILAKHTEVRSTVLDDLEAFLKKKGLITNVLPKFTTPGSIMKIKAIDDQQRVLNKANLQIWLAKQDLSKSTRNPNDWKILQKEILHKRAKRSFKYLDEDWINSQAVSRYFTEDDLMEFLKSKGLNIKYTDSTRKIGIASKSTQERNHTDLIINSTTVSEGTEPVITARDTPEPVTAIIIVKTPPVTERALSGEQLIAKFAKDRLITSTKNDLELFLKSKGLISVSGNLTTRTKPKPSSVPRRKTTAMPKTTRELIPTTATTRYDIGMHAFLMSKAVERENAMRTKTSLKIAGFSKISSSGKVLRRRRFSRVFRNSSEPNLKAKRGKTKPVKKLICGDTVTKQTKYTFVVSILKLLYQDTLDGVKYLCSGAIVSKNWILSSSECFENHSLLDHRLIERVFARAGSKFWSKDGATYKIQRLIHPPIFSENHPPCLIAMEIEYHFLNIPAMKPIQLSEKPIFSDDSRTAPKLLGWYGDERLDFGVRKKYGGLKIKNMVIAASCNIHTPGVFCGRDSNVLDFCDFMAGAPLAKGRFLLGIHIATVCKSKNSHHHFINLKYYYKWLIENVLIT